MERTSLDPEIRVRTFRRQLSRKNLNVGITRRQNQDPDSDGGVIGEAAKSYKKFLKSSGLVDKWDIVRTCILCLEENKSKVKILISEISPSDVDLVFHIRDYSESMEADSVTIVGLGDLDSTSGAGNDSIHVRFRFCCLKMVMALASAPGSWLT